MVYTYAMQMRIHNPNKLPTIDYRVVKPLQENLKDLHTAEHDDLVSILKKRGFKQPLNLWHKGDEFFLMDGHQRQRVLIKNDMNDNGSYEVPYFVTEAATKKEAVEQLLEITSQFGKTTLEGLEELTALYDLDLSELDVHFDALDLDKFLDDQVDDDEADDEAPEVDEVNPPVSVLGEVYQLGAHRLMCGDSTSLEAVEQLMDGAKADVVFTDPPYNFETQGGMTDKFYKKTAEDIKDIVDFKPSEWLTTLSSYFGKGMNAYIFCNKDLVLDYLLFARDNGFSANILVWKKPNTSPFGDSHRPDIEYLILIRKNAIFNNGLDVSYSRCLEFNKDTSTIHPTMKPIGLITTEILISSKRGGIVADSFGGSGSTLIAAEKTGRICYMLELDEKYVDVIRKRYWKLVNGSEEGWENGTPVVQAMQQANS